MLWRIGPFDSGVEPFRVLPEDDHVHERLLESSRWFLANEIQGIAGKRNTRADAGIQMETLAHGDDRAEVGIALALQFGLEFGLGFLLGLGSDGAEQSEFVPGKQVTVRSGKALPSLRQHSQPMSA